MTDRQRMNILILGATGFIGSAVAQQLLAQGHTVSGLCRNLQAARIREPRIAWMEGDLRQLTTAAAWKPFLAATGAVINCAGVLQDSVRDDVAAVQETAMIALYEAAKAIPGIRIVQISAARNLQRSNTRFIATKLKADAALANSGLAHVILRPALVLGRNAHGGSALLRALAAFPLVTPLAWPDTLVETVSLRRIAIEVSNALHGTLQSGSDIDLVDNTMTLRDLVAAHRKWLGLEPVRTFPVSGFASNFVSRLADLAGRFGWRSPLRSTAMLIAAGGIQSTRTAHGATGQILPPDMTDNPAGAQDLWFARLYLFKPAMILTLAFFWIVSGAVPLMNPAGAATGFAHVLRPETATSVTLATSLADIMLGVAILFRSYARKAMLGMILLSAAYLAGATFIQPALWLDPLGPLVKIFPALALTFATLAILEER